MGIILEREKGGRGKIRDGNKIGDRERCGKRDFARVARETGSRAEIGTVETRQDFVRGGGEPGNGTRAEKGKDKRIRIKAL